MNKYFWDTVHYLNDPQHVANFQKYFGLERLDTKKSETDAQLYKHVNGFTRQQYEKILETPPTTDCDNDSESKESSESERENKEFVIHNRLWYWMFSIATAFGDEIFYASVFPFWFWNIDGAVGRRVINVWCLSMFIGQCLKDIICWPRPSCPPVVQIQKKWAMEYGMPSTHAMVSATVPFSVILLTVNRYEYPVFVGVIIAVIWCLMVSTSRLYLGMHSVLDVLAGLLLAFVLLPILIPLLDKADAFLLTHPASPGLVITTTITLILIYPGSKFSMAKEDTAIILGSSAGIQLGAWLSYQMGSIRGPPLKPPYSIIWPSYEMLGISLLRTIIGLIIVVATRAVMKSVSFATMQALVKLRKDKWYKDNKHSAELFVKLGYKLITYASIGINIICFAPAVFRLLGIERPTFHTEM